MKKISYWRIKKIMLCSISTEGYETGKYNFKLNFTCGKAENQKVLAFLLIS